MLVAEKYAGVRDAESKNMVIVFVFVFLVSFGPMGRGNGRLELETSCDGGSRKRS
jgi:hypothetical protein